MLELIVAAVAFVGWHVGVSSTALRGTLVGWLGEKLYISLFSLVTLALLLFLIYSYRAVPHSEFLWAPSSASRWVAILVMPVALILLVGGLMSPNPTLVGRESTAAAFEQGKGMLRVTRHGFLWATFLWAFAHMIANPDLASLLFFGSFGVLALLGTVLIDRKKALSLGENWPHFSRVTSNVPCAAILGGRNRLQPTELWPSVVIGLALYAVLLWGHVWVSGVPLF